MRPVVCFLALLVLGSPSSNASVSHRKRAVASRRGQAARSTKRPQVVIAGGPWIEPTYADATDGDNADGEDLDVRRAAVDALKPYNGSVVVVDSSNGRILTIVNQKSALGSGFQPCSTIKVAIALAALNEELVEPGIKVNLNATRMDLTSALAHSNNYFFARLGQRIGFEKINDYAHQFGYGEQAGLNIPDEASGSFPSRPPRNGGVGMLSSFGEGISQTPLQFAALMSTVANGGTLYYLQYPRTAQEIAGFVPTVKRHLDMQLALSDIMPGLRGAVETGTAHRARQEAPIAGKTGTCSENHTHLGWFGAFNDFGDRKLVVVVLLTGGRPASGPFAAAIAGDIYSRLYRQNYFSVSATSRSATIVPGSVSIP